MSTSAYIGSADSHFNKIDGTDQGTFPGAKSSSHGRLQGCCRVIGNVILTLYFLLLTAVAVIAFILGSYATSRVRRSLDAVLVSDPTTAPGPGYSVFSLGTGLGYWSPTTDMLYTRSDHGVISYGKYAYLIGGYTYDSASNVSKVLNSTVRYDTETGVLYEMRPLLEARCRFAYAELNGDIYVMGGTDDVISGTPNNMVFVYNTTSNMWRNIGKLTTPRVDACGAAVNGKVYVFGGYDSKFHSLGSVEVCDPATAVGSASAVCTPLPVASNLLDHRGDCRSVSMDGLIYAVGGAQWYEDKTQSCNDSCYRFLNTTEAFDPTTGRWSHRAQMISPRGDFGIEVLPGSRFIVAGGEKGNGTRTAIAMYDVEEYIAMDNIWVQKAPLPEARFRADLAYVAGRVYAFGGTPTCDLQADPQCTKVTLKSVYAYFDVQYPRLYAFFKTATSNS